jgi:hypothetical protein
VTVKKVGDKKQLNFEGLVTKGDHPEPVGAAVGESTGEGEPSHGEGE